MSCTSLSVSVSNLPVLLYLSVACCGSSVHHKTGYSLYLYLEHSTTYIHSVPPTRPFSPIARTHPPHFFPLHPHAWSSGQSTRGVAEVGRKPRLTSWMASSQTDAIPLHLPHIRQYGVRVCHTIFISMAPSMRDGCSPEKEDENFALQRLNCVERI